MSDVYVPVKERTMEKIMDKLIPEILVEIGYKSFEFNEIEPAMEFAKMAYLTAKNEAEVKVTITFGGGEEE